MTLVWIDQSGFLLQPTRRRTWALAGHTPRHKVWSRHDRVSVQAAVTLPPRRQRLGVYFRVYEQNIHTQDVVSFVGYMMSMIRRKIVLILDRWSVHRAAVAILQKRYADRLTIEWLPAYAPELNPVEQVWNHTKYGDLANFRPEHIDHLADAVTMSMTAQHHDNPLIRGFFKYAQLTL